MALYEGIDPGRICFQQGLRFALKAAGLHLRHPSPAEGANEAVIVQRGIAEHLREGTAADATVHFHLP